MVNENIIPLENTKAQIVEISEIETYQEILMENNLTAEEIQALLAKQTELCQLEEHLTSLQSEQQA